MSCKNEIEYFLIEFTKVMSKYSKSHSVRATSTSISLKGLNKLLGLLLNWQEPTFVGRMQYLQSFKDFGLQP
jgi:hypothetical protein